MDTVDLVQEHKQMKMEIAALRDALMNSARTFPIYTCGFCSGVGKLTPYRHMIFELTRPQVPADPQTWDESVDLTNRFLKSQEARADEQQISAQVKP